MNLAVSLKFELPVPKDDHVFFLPGVSLEFVERLWTQFSNKVTWSKWCFFKHVGPLFDIVIQVFRFKYVLSCFFFLSIW